ncbi:MAG: hypothetical protein KF778_00840 [Rhodocyclaceae bacterium]|nr:hypothetical protein [Rhodocyclaceae bacterium]MBX3666925.1 hypothetical protein [Rhodocyclaceae bacterium]
MRARIVRYLAERAWLSFILMGVAFFAFGVASLNLIVTIRANLELFYDHGIMVFGDGGGQQLLELLGYGYLSMAFYIAAKACEKLLVDRLTRKD